MVSRIVHIRPNFRLSSCLGSLKSKNFDPNKQQLFLFFAETLLNESKETDDNSTENGSNNGEMTSQLGSGGIDPSSMLAAREKTLISHAMDTLSRRVAENGSGGNGSSGGGDPYGLYLYQTWAAATQGKGPMPPAAMQAAAMQAWSNHYAQAVKVNFIFI